MYNTSRDDTLLSSLSPCSLVGGSSSVSRSASNAMRVAVVTGSNQGIGLAIVRQLCAQFDGAVYLTSRDVARGQAAVDQLKELGLSPHYHQLDISDKASVEKLRDHLLDKYGGLDVLINNAAIAYKSGATEPFSTQAEHTVRVNFFDLVSTCHTLFPILRAHARVVNVSSVAGHLTKIPGERLRQRLADPALTEDQLCTLMRQFVDLVKSNAHEGEGWPSQAYAVSKVGVSALTFVQQRAFDLDPRADLVVNAVHPGYCDTEMTSHKGLMTVDEGASAPVYLALLQPHVLTPRGRYIWRDQQEVDWVKGPLPGPY